MWISASEAQVALPALRTMYSEAVKKKTEWGSGTEEAGWNWQSFVNTGCGDFIPRGESQFRGMNNFRGGGREVRRKSKSSPSILFKKCRRSSAVR